MTTLSADEAAALLPDLHFVGPCWSGTAFVPFWGTQIPVNFATVADRRLVPRQLRILRDILGYPHDLRAAFEQRLFAFYQQYVFNCIDFGPDDDGRDLAGILAPRLTHPGEIWRLIDGPEVYLNWCCKAEHESAVEFALNFTCTWDDEHGLGVRYRDWQITYIGGSGG